MTFAGAHDAGWIHLDVKPENVCIAALGPEGEEEGEGEGENAQKRNNFATVRLIDFGHARPFPNGLTKIVGEAGSDSYAAVSVDWFLSFFFFFLLLEVFVSSLTSSFLLSSLSFLLSSSSPLSLPTTPQPEVLHTMCFSKTSDTWSFGILLYAMLSGSLPWPEGRQSDFLCDQNRIASTLDHAETRFDNRIVDVSFLNNKETKRETENLF